MIERVIEILKNYQEINDYRIVSIDKVSSEAYYILDSVETVRNVHSNAKLTLTIYVDYEDKRGTSTITLFNSMSEEEIKGKIKEAIKETKFSKNTYFELPKGTTKVFGSQKHIIKNDVPLKIAEAVLEAKTSFKDGWISCNEVFIRENKVRIVNSRGVDYTYYTNSISIEVIPTFKNEGGEIELYTNLDYEDVDYNRITNDVYDFLKNASLRNQAKKYEGPTKLPVMLDDAEILDIFSNLVGNLDYGVAYNKMNILNIGDKFYGENPLEAPDITLVPVLAGSSLSRPVDSDGICLVDTKVVENNEVLTMHGSNTSAYYLGIKNPTGQISNLYLADGKNDFAKLEEKPYLHCLAFSSFQFDLFSGNFGGEVRLALYFDGKDYKPVTGLTISGNIHKLKSRLLFSNERVVRRGYSGPKNMLVEEMSIN